MQNQIQKYEKLDMNVSLMRIIACLIVIGCHVRISPIIGDSINKPILYLHDFFDDGVAIFFCIVGFFLYNNKSYKNLWKKAVKNILIPAFLLTMISILLSKFIEGASLLNSIKDSELNFGVLLRDFVSIDLKNHNFTGHLWYITSYFELIIFFPVTKLIINEYEKGNKNILNWVLGIGIFDLVVNDVQALYMLPCGEITVHEIFPTPQLLCLIGYRIYIEKDKIKNNKKCRIFGLLGMLVANTIRFFAQYYLLKKDISALTRQQAEAEGLTPCSRCGGGEGGLVYKTGGGRTYHSQDCPYLFPDLTPMSEDEAVGIGLTPCGLCIGGENYFR